ncbi:MAG: manganese catalase family protein [Clostridia bacterium]|nr:manganese catalase family protein [Clostridia bacterium]
MFVYEKKLQYPVKIKNPNPKYAQIIISQYGGPDGELGASLRYLSQRFAMPFDEVKGLLTDIGTSVVLWSLRAFLPSSYDISFAYCSAFG